MNEAMWSQRRPLPAGPVDSLGVWDGQPGTLADVTELRLHLREGSLMPPAVVTPTTRTSRDCCWSSRN